MIEVPFELADELRDQLLAHVEAELPNEACAMLIGSLQNGVIGVLPVENASMSPHRYSISPSELIRAYDHAESSRDEVIGVAHSHPTGSAVPSPIDEREASVRSWLYLVVGAGGEIRGFRLRSGP